MTREARIWAAAAAAVVLVAGSVLAFGQVTGTFAIFTAETENQGNTLVAGWIPPPSGASSSLNGSPYLTEHLSWTSGSTSNPPSPNPVTGQTIEYADGGSGGSASCGSYSTFSTIAAGTTTADLTGTQLADWWCFRVYSTSASATTSGSWTSDVVPFTAQRIFVPSGSVTLNNVGGGTAGKIDNGDTIVITYNQTRSNVGNVNVLACTTGDIYIGTGALSCGGAADIGTITGLTIGKQRTCNTSTTAGNGTATLTVALANCAGGGQPTVSGTGSFTATGTGVTSSGGQNACTSNPTCSVATSGDF